MHAIILAAGMGRRFQPEPLGYPKCLLEFGGKSLLARSIENLAWAGVDAVTVVVGYRAELIGQAVEQLAAQIPIDLRYNPKYEGGSADSVVCAADVFEKHRTLLLDADVLYDRRILPRLLESGDENVILMEHHAAGDLPEYWLLGEQGRLTGVYKGSAKPPDAVGVYWGVHKFSPAFGKRFVACARTMIRKNAATEYWHVVPHLFSEIPVRFIDTAGMVYYEMDTWQEVEWGRAYIYPRLEAQGQT